MSWLDDITPDAGNPSTGMILGLLGGLGKAAAPQFNGNMGISGQSKGNALLQLFGDLSGGVQGGMAGAQDYRAHDIANQGAGINLQNQKTLNPLMMQARMNSLQGAAGNTNPTGLPGNMAQGGQLPGSMAPQLSPYQQNASHMIDSANMQFAMTGDPKPLTDAWKSAFENDPSLAAEKAKQGDLNKVQTTPNGPMAGYQIPGMSDAPGGAGSPGLFGSLAPMGPSPIAPAITSSVMKGIIADREPGGIGPGNQTPAEIPTPEGQGVSPPPQSGYQGAAGAVPVQPGQIPPMNASQLQAPPGPPQAQPPMPPPPQGQPPAAPPQQQQMPPRQAAFMPPQNPQTNQLQALIAQQQTAKAPFVPADGKPILDGVNDSTPPNPFGQPHFTTPNTTNGVADHNKLRDTAVEQDTELNATGQQTAQMLARLHDMASAAQSGQMGSLIAQDPELAQKAVAAGLIKDGKLTNDLSQIQRFQSDQMMEVINQLKMTNAGPGGGKLMRAEVQGAAEKMADPTQQPQAIHDILAIGQGLGNYNQDMLKAWQAKGGMGNSLNNGDSMLAQNFQARFSTSHNIDDYIKQAKQQMPPFKGMPTNSAAGPKNYVRINGRLVAQ